MAYVNFKNSPSEETPLTGGATGNLNVMQENGTSHGTDTKLGYAQSFLNEHIINVSNEVDDTYRVNLINGKNLFDKDTMVELVGGFRGYSNGEISTNASYNGLKIPVKPNTTYTFYSDATYSNLAYYDNNFNYLNGIAFNYTNSAHQFTTPNNCYYITLAVHSGATKRMLNEGSTAQPYEEFISNQMVVDNEKYSDTLNVGTNLDNRSRVNVLKSNNLLPNNGSTITTNGITFAKNSDGSLTINGTASGGRADYYLFGGSSDNGNYLKIKKGTYSFNRSNLTDGTMFVAFREKTAGSKYETTTNNSAIETMASQDCYFYGVMIGVENGKTINNLTIYPMLNEGNTLLPYEPYVVPSIYVDNEEIYSKGVILWTNSNTGIAFDPQDVNISDLSDYKYYEVIYKLHASTLNYYQTSGKVPTGLSTCIGGGYARPNSTPRFWSRYITYADTKLTFSTGYYSLNFNDNANTANDILVPYQILGYK